MGARAAHAYGPNPIFRATSAVPMSVAMIVAAVSILVSQSSLIEGAAWLALSAVLFAAIPRRVEVGAEGLRIAWLGSSRLVRYDDVRRAEPAGPDAVRITFRNGETVRLVRGVFDASSPHDVLERLWTAVALGAEAGPRPNERAALLRGHRSIEAWLAALRELVARGGHYRQGLAAPDRLLSLATNPAAEIELRVAAAVACALAGALDEATREELRAIAALSVDETLQAAFGRVAASDLETALREVA